MIGEDRVYPANNCFRHFIQHARVLLPPQYRQLTMALSFAVESRFLRAQPKGVVRETLPSWVYLTNSCSQTLVLSKTTRRWIQSECGLTCHICVVVEEYHAPNRRYSCRKAFACLAHGSRTRIPIITATAAMYSTAHEWPTDREKIKVSLDATGENGWLQSWMSQLLRYQECKRICKRTA